MASDDLRYHLILYGIYYNDWKINFGGLSDHQHLLLEDYISDACSTEETSEASDTNRFLFPFHVKKKYFIEGIIKGHITVASSTATSHVTSYRVSVCSMNEDTTDTELFTTGWVSVDDTLGWDSTYSVPSIIEGEEGERVYAFWIDAWSYATLGEYDRIYLKVEANCDSTAVLWHSNDSTYQDIYVDIPLRL